MRAELAEEPVLDDGDAVGVVRGVQAVGDRDDRPALRAPRRANAPGGARRAGRAATSPRRGRACAGRRGRAARARAAGSAAASAARRPRRPSSRGPRAAPPPTRARRPPPARPRARLAEASGRASRRLSAQRADEDVLLLRDERDLLPERLERQLDETDSADLDRPRAGRVDPGEQPAEGRLARARRPDDGDTLPRPRSRSIPCSTSRPGT